MIGVILIAAGILLLGLIFGLGVGFVLFIYIPGWLEYWSLCREQKRINQHKAEHDRPLCDQ